MLLNYFASYLITKRCCTNITYANIDVESDTTMIVLVFFSSFIAHKFPVDQDVRKLRSKISTKTIKKKKRKMSSEIS